VALVEDQFLRENVGKGWDRLGRLRGNMQEMVHEAI
jgi:hypothetical protein